MAGGRPLALITGLGRRAGIAYGIALRLAADGWDIAFSHNTKYDASTYGGADDVDSIARPLEELGAEVDSIETDLASVTAASHLFDSSSRLGTVTALILSHAHSTAGGILTQPVDDFDRHFFVNTRASWLLIREFVTRFENSADLSPNRGRIVALTSDAVMNEVAYGASKAALDRIVFAAAREFGASGITANLINPGPIDTGWMTAQVREELRNRTPVGRLGQPSDTASLVSYLLSEDGGWINGQLLKSDGGFSTLA